MKEKFEWIEFSIEERELFEKHLNEMSNLGWQIKGITRNYLYYQQEDEVKEYIIDICENPNKNDSYKIDRNVRKQIEMYEEFGYKFVCNFANFLVFESNGKERMIHTDEEVENRLIEESKRRHRMRYIYIPTIIEIVVILTIMLFLKEVLLLILSSTAYMLLLIMLVVINFNEIFLEFIMNKISMEERPKLRVKARIIQVFMMVICLCLLSFALFNSVIYPFTLFIGGIIVVVFNYKNTNKRLRGEINGGNAKVNWFLFQILLITVVNLSREIKVDENPMILSEDITGIVNEVEIGMDNQGFFLDLIDVNLITKDEVYQYQYYDLKETFLTPFIYDLILDQYSDVIYLYEINDVKVYQFEETIKVRYAGYPDIIRYKMALVHNNDVMIINCNLEEDENHIQSVINELGWN